MQVKCPNCKQYYHSDGITAHWQNHPNCQSPNLTKKQKDIIRGLLMGDGTIDRHGKSWYVNVRMTNPDFLNWVDEQMGIFTTGTKFSLSGEEHKEQCLSEDSSSTINYAVGDWKDIYQLKFRAVSDIDSLCRKWWTNGRKRFPNSLKFTKTVAKVWYAGDGGLRWRNRPGHPEVCFTITNEFHRVKYIESLFRQKGFTGYKNKSKSMYCLSQGQTKNFLRWLGDPLPGFDYKWEYKARYIYDEKKKEADHLALDSEADIPTYEEALSW